MAAPATARPLHTGVRPPEAAEPPYAMQSAPRSGAFSGSARHPWHRYGDIAPAHENLPALAPARKKQVVGRSPEAAGPLRRWNSRAAGLFSPQTRPPWHRCGDAARAHENRSARAPLPLALSGKKEVVGRSPEATGPLRRWNSRAAGLFSPQMSMVLLTTTANENRWRAPRPERDFWLCRTPPACGTARNHQAPRSGALFTSVPHGAAAATPPPPMKTRQGRRGAPAATDSVWVGCRPPKAAGTPPIYRSTPRSGAIFISDRHGPRQCAMGAHAFACKPPPPAGGRGLPAGVRIILDARSVAPGDRSTRPTPQRSSRRAPGLSGLPQLPAAPQVGSASCRLSGTSDSGQ